MTLTSPPPTPSFSFLLPPLQGVVIYPNVVRLPIVVLVIPSPASPTATPVMNPGPLSA